jgi:hypothetical protein
MGTTPTRGGPQDPRIAKIKEIQSRNPGFTRHQAFQSVGVGVSILNRWVEQGLIEPFPKLPKNYNSPWRGKGNTISNVKK